uniref:Uncharacterized protein n=1 Tax=Opuntia streptacantha TaxID=393608 RepID=A0A7C9EWG8_OPUST
MVTPQLPMEGIVGLDYGRPGNSPDSERQSPLEEHSPTTGKGWAKVTWCLPSDISICGYGIHHPIRSGIHSIRAKPICWWGASPCLLSRTEPCDYINRGGRPHWECICRGTGNHAGV